MGVSLTGAPSTDGVDLLPFVDGAEGNALSGGQFSIVGEQKSAVGAAVAGAIVAMDVARIHTQPSLQTSASASGTRATAQRTGRPSGTGDRTSQILWVAPDDLVCMQEC